MKNEKTLGGLLKQVALLVGLSFIIASCGSDGNGVDGEGIRRNGDSFTSSGAIQSLLRRNNIRCNGGYIVDYFYAPSSGEQNRIRGGFTSSGRRSNNGSLSAEFLGVNFEVGDYIVVREFASGAAIAGYEIELHMCRIGGVDQRIQQMQGSIFLSRNGQTSIGEVNVRNQNFQTGQPDLLLIDRSGTVFAPAFAGGAR